VATARKTKRSGGRKRRGRARPQAEPEVEVRPSIVEDPPGIAPLPAPEHSLDDLTLSAPEPMMAARVPEPEPVRPLPSGRRAIFFDVENTSRAEHIARVIAHLAVDRAGRRTEFLAVGNWRVIGHDTARLLARHGAALVHSAPSVGVRDWSDLRIAVASGVWLAGARPGDVIEIVSDDRAFDAVGDVAASLGVTFRRLSYRALLGMPTPEPVETERVERDYGHGDRGGRRRRRRGGRGRGDHGAPRPVQHVPQQQPPPRPVVISGPEPHTAPHDEIVAVVRDLARSRGTVTLDSLANALKARGFSRPPGSPRLITRLRRIKELEVNRAGVITLVDGTAAPVTPAVESEEHGEIVADAFEPITADAEEAPVPSSPPERSEEIAEVAVDAEAEAPDPRNREGAHLQTAVGGDGGRRHRRSRRGGRRRRGRGGDGREGGGRDGGGGRPGGGGGGTPPRDGGSGPRSSGADRARDVASRYAPRDVAPSWISGQPLA
jgi:uncharacterized membrane protein YgcG